MKCNCIVLTLLLSITVRMISGQTQAPTTTSLLGVPAANWKTEIQDEKVEYLKKTRFELPLIDNIEFGIRNQAFNPKRHRYSLRIEPRGLGETGASSRLYHKNLEYNTHKKELIRYQTLRDRYTMVYEFLLQDALLKQQKELLLLYEDKIQVMRKLVGNVKWEISDLIKVENDYSKLKFDNMQIERDLNVWRSAIRKVFKNDSFEEFDTTGLVTVASIAEQLKDATLRIDTNNIYLKDLHLEYQYNKCRYELENATGRRVVNSIEFSYDRGDHLDELADLDDPKKSMDANVNNAYIISVDIPLPLLNSNRHDLHRRKLDFLSAKEDYETLKDELTYQFNKDIMDIQKLVAQYTFLSSREKDINAEKSLKRYLKMDGADPLTLLSIRESILKDRAKEEEARFVIMRNYIQIMDLAGKLMQKPLKNYLSSNLEQFSYE